MPLNYTPSSCCDICFEDYTDHRPPSVLPCGHVFCADCLRKLPNLGSSTVAPTPNSNLHFGVVTCPHCCERSFFGSKAFPTRLFVDPAPAPAAPVVFVQPAVVAITQDDIVSSTAKASNESGIKQVIPNDTGESCWYHQLLSGMLTLFPLPSATDSERAHLWGVAHARHTHSDQISALLLILGSD